MDTETIHNHLELLEGLLSGSNLSPELVRQIEINQALLQLRLDNPDFRLADVEAITARAPAHRAGVLGDMEIEAAMHDGLIVIEPFDERLMGSCSYDVRLGHYYYIARTDDNAKPSFSPFGRKDVERHFTGPMEAVHHGEYCDDAGLQLFEGIDEDEYIIPIPPGHSILAHTSEFIGFLFGGTTMMKAKSTTGRVDVSVCDDAGWGDVGYVNRWTLEVRNKHTKQTVAMVKGMAFGQLIFMWSSGASINYGFSGNYQQGLDVGNIRDTWSHTDLLPKGFVSAKSKSIRTALSRLKHDKRH